MAKKDTDWETLLNFDDDKDEIINTDLNDQKIYEKDNKQLAIYEKDYKNLFSAESILKDKSYYQSKYYIITKHLINMDDYYLALENIQNKLFGEPVASESISSSNSKSSSKISNGKEIGKDLNTFKLGNTNKLLDIFENENMTKKEFGEYVRRTLYLMFLMINKENYVIYYPKKISLNKLSLFIKKYFERDDYESYENKENEDDDYEDESYESKEKDDESFGSRSKENDNVIFEKKIIDDDEIYENKINDIEIDVVINDFEKDDFYNLEKKYQNNFYFVEQLHLRDIEDKFNIIGVIAKNLIYQVGNKKFQASNYINIFHNLNLIREGDINKQNSDLQSILKSFNIKDISKNNIFLFITSGPYLLFRIIFDILNELFKIEKEDFVFEDYIKEKINKHNNILSNLIETKKNIIKNVENLYHFFSDLRNRKINHCVLYIGTNSENLKDDEFFKIVSIINKKDNKSVGQEDKNIVEEKEFNENIKEFNEIINLKNGIRNILSIKDDFYTKFELFAENVNKKLNNSDNKVFNKIDLKNNYKLVLNIYLTEEKSINTMSEHFQINKIINKNLNKEFIIKIIKDRKKNEIYLFLLPGNEANHFFGLNHDNIFIGPSDNPRLNLMEQFSIRFDCSGGVYNRYLKDKFIENYNEKKTKLKSILSLLKYSNLYEIFNIIDNELKPEFEIDKESFKRSFENIVVESEISDDLIVKIKEEMKRTCQKELNEDLIRQNIKKFEEKIKIKLFCDCFINNVLFNVCSNSIINNFKNLNDNIFMN